MFVLQIAVKQTQLLGTLTIGLSQTQRANKFLKTNTQVSLLKKKKKVC